MELSIATDIELAKQLVPSLGREECAATEAAGAMAASGLPAEQLIPPFLAEELSGATDAAEADPATVV
jgi:hypothetical protein